MPKPLIDTTPVTAVAIAEPALRKPNSSTSYHAAPDQFELVIAPLLPAQQETLRFWYFLGKEKGWSLGKLATESGMSTTSLSRIFRGEYGAGLGNVCETLAKARATYAESVGNPDFIETSLWHDFSALCNRTRAMSTVTFMWGEMGIGKTSVAKEYQRRNNHGRTIYYRASPGLTYVQFVHEIAAACSIYAKNQTHLLLREKIFTVLGAGHRLWIVDEMHQPFLRRSQNDITAIMICEFLREIYDRTGCGQVLIGTKVLRNHMLNQKQALAQLLDRGTMQVELRTKPSVEDVKAFIRHYALPDLDPAAEPEACATIKDILRVAGLRMLTLRLRDGAATAARKGEPYTWEHFNAAFRAVNKLATENRIV